jgi:ribosome-binding factor A
VSSNARADNLAKLIREVVAEKIQRGIKDPRIKNHQVTVTDTRVTGDLRESTVFYTVYGDDEARAEVAAGLESARGMLRTAVGRAAGIKHTPSLAFLPDALPDNARAMESLFDAARARDAELRQQAEGASYAGDPDPYGPEPSAADDEGDDESDAGKDTAPGTGGPAGPARAADED